METKDKQFIKDNLNLGLDYDFEDDLMQIYSSSNWTASTKEEYEVFESIINSYKHEDNLCIITVWCDISGFDYWILQQEESNYVSIDVQFKKDNYTYEEVREIANNIWLADEYFLTELTQYSYDS